ncbi:integrator complex subunit 15-like [Mytilus trossulus]|uniref:integrator complex subunit 15-like n=1 Tax=Mytilus trossulus TaxID=6551 RepID=UPI003006CC01
MTTKILQKLRPLDFPECSKQAINYLVSCFSSDDHGTLPGLSGAPENLAHDVAKDYILFTSQNQRGHRRLNALQELHMLEMLSTAIDEISQGSRYKLFNVIFGGKHEPAKTSLLTKLVSLALSVRCGAVLDCAALWMQEQGCHSDGVCKLAHSLVEEYCMLYPSVSEAFHGLPKVSPLFTCNFISAAVTIFYFNDNHNIPPLGLLDAITDWISSDSCLCFESVRLVRIQSSFSCPVFGLFRWCILGHLVTACNHDKKIDMETSTKTFALLSKLHLCILQNLQAYKSMELNQILFHLQDFISIATAVRQCCQNWKISEDNFYMLIERIGQVLQVAIVTESLKIDQVTGTEGLKELCSILPPNRLLKIIYNHHSQRGNQHFQPMDTS